MQFPPIHNVRNIKNLKDMLEQSTKFFADKSAFYIKCEDNSYKEITYANFKMDIDALGTVLLELGFKNESIALIGENRYEWCASYLSIVNGVGVVVPLDRELPIQEIQNLLVSSGANAIIYSGKILHDQLKQISPNLCNIRYYINMDLLQHEDDNFLSYKVLLDRGRQLLNSGIRNYIDASIDEKVMTALIYTSGTTDYAKGVMLSHKNICTNIISVTSSLHIDSNDSVLSILPLHHTYECTAGFLTMIYNGATISFNEGLKHIGKNLQETRPTILISVPLILENMYKKIWLQAKKKKMLLMKLKLGLCVSNILYNIFKINLRKKIFRQIHENVGGRLRLIISGAAGIEPLVSKGLHSFGLKIRQGYGLTEASPIVAVNRDRVFRDDSAGLPLPGLDVKINNPDDDGLGEILVKGDSVMLGYYNNAAATESVLKNGWLHTGDIARMDKDGFIYITGRQKNVIVTKNGKNIFPEEVESYINKSPYIVESLVVGKIEEKTGETIVSAQIVPDTDVIKAKFKMDSTPTDDVIYKLIKSEIKNINKSMPLYKRITDISLREMEFSKTTTKKIKRYLA